MAESFLRLAASGSVREAFDSYVAEGFLHHNPSFPGDAESLAAAMQQNAAENPEKTLEVKRSLNDGDLVAVHSHVQLKPGGPEFATVHIFRFDDGRIAELWDIAQPVPEDSPNQYGMI